MRHLAMTGMETASMISRIFLGEAMRATPPSARICAGTRSSAITETAPARSAISACPALVTSIMTPPLSISARPVFSRRLPLPLVSDITCPFHPNLHFTGENSRLEPPYSRDRCRAENEIQGSYRIEELSDRVTDH